MTPSRQSREQNNYFDKPYAMLAEHYAELSEQSRHAFELFLSLEAARTAVWHAMAEAPRE